MLSAYGKWIKDGRTRQNLSQEEVSEVFGVSESQVRRWELGKRGTRVYRLYKVAVDLGAVPITGTQKDTNFAPPRIFDR